LGSDVKKASHSSCRAEANPKHASELPEKRPRRLQKTSEPKKGRSGSAVKRLNLYPLMRQDFYPFSKANTPESAERLNCLKKTHPKTSENL
jgi:hypothetical protein